MSSSDVDNRVNANVVSLVESCNSFAMSLYSRIPRSQDNIIFSPSSLSFALAMTLAGANGKTADEIASVLGLSMSADCLHEAFRKLRTETRTGGCELRIASRLWAQQGYKFVDDFLATTESCYGATLGTIDFLNDPDQARNEINNWIETATEKRIREIIGPGMLNEDVRLLLTNAIYFLGTWEDEFDKERTSDSPFFVSPSQSVTVPMMEQTNRFRYGEFNVFQVLEMPYRSRITEWRMDDEFGYMKSVEVPGGGSDFTMCIVLPKLGTNLAKLESGLNNSTLQQWTTLRTCDVHVSIPRFRIETGLEMAQLLQKLGMKKAFSQTHADFSNITHDPEGLFVGSVIHKAFVDVNEKGTEAAAATAIMMALGCAMEPKPPKKFRADRPFLFFIRDRRTKLIHFMGRVTNPIAHNQN
jgi:serine protease inhibitor